MFFSIQELQQRKVRFHEIFQQNSIELFDQQLRQASPLETGGTAEFSNATAEIRVKGHLKVEMAAQCDRCLETAAFPIDTEFDLTYRPTPDVALPEVVIPEDESEVGFYQGNGLELTDVIREQILLSLPMQRICREDCKGICPVCGGNRNTNGCDCRPKIPDDRWAGLRNL